jgi:hypothetical protein
MHKYLLCASRVNRTLSVTHLGDGLQSRLEPAHRGVPKTFSEKLGKNKNPNSGNKGIKIPEALRIGGFSGGGTPVSVSLASPSTPPASRSGSIPTPLPLPFRLDHLRRCLPAVPFWFRQKPPRRPSSYTTTTLSPRRATKGRDYSPHIVRAVPIVCPVLYVLIRASLSATTR